MPKSPHIPWGSFAASWLGLDFFMLCRGELRFPCNFWWIQMLINTPQPPPHTVGLGLQICFCVAADRNVLIAPWFDLCQADIWWGIKPDSWENGGISCWSILQRLLNQISLSGGMKKKIIRINRAKIVFLGSALGISWSFLAVVWPLACFPEGRRRWNISQNQLSINWIVLQRTVVNTEYV